MSDTGSQSSLRQDLDACCKPYYDHAEHNSAGTWQASPRKLRTASTSELKFYEIFTLILKNCSNVFDEINFLNLTS
jgi:hypothetical protein